MQREDLSIVVRRCAGWSSVSEQDAGAVRPVADVRGFGFRLHRSVWLISYGGVWGWWSLLMAALGELGVWHAAGRLG